VLIGKRGGDVAVGEEGVGVSAHCWQWLVVTVQTGGQADTSQGTILLCALCFSAAYQLDGSCSLVKNVHPPTVTQKKQC